jgi:hypothetical protein
MQPPTTRPLALPRPRDLAAHVGVGLDRGGHRRPILAVNGCGGLALEILDGLGARDLGVPFLAGDLDLAVELVDRLLHLVELGLIGRLAEILLLAQRLELAVGRRPLRIERIERGGALGAQVRDAHREPH